MQSSVKNRRDIAGVISSRDAGRRGEDGIPRFLVCQANTATSSERGTRERDEERPGNRRESSVKEA